jgi:hypothetical protein
MNPFYGYYDFDSVINTDISYSKRVYNASPKICKDAELEFSSFAKNNQQKGYGYTYVDKGVCLDNCRDIFAIINEIKSDINRYKKIGIEVTESTNGTREFSFYTVADRLENKLKDIYELL